MGNSLVDVKIAALLRAAAQKCDASLREKKGAVGSDVSDWLEKLLQRGSVEVGYRASCGKTDSTTFAYREWQKIVSKAQKNGLKIQINPVRNGNAWATKAGGFWTSNIYSLS